jgi:hypothetical protein
MPEQLSFSQCLIQRQALDIAAQIKVGKFSNREYQMFIQAARSAMLQANKKTLFCSHGLRPLCAGSRIAHSANSL